MTAPYLYGYPLGFRQTALDSLSYFPLWPGGAAQSTNFSPSYFNPSADPLHPLNLLLPKSQLTTSKPCSSSKDENIQEKTDIPKAIAR